MADLPPVTTATTMQGNEAEILLCSFQTHGLGNKITKTGPGTLVEQITKSSANEKAGEAVRVPYLIEMVNERAQARQVYDVSSARFTKLSSTMPSLVIPPKNDQADEDGWSDSQATAEEDAKAEAAKAKEDAVKADAAKKAAAKEEAAKKAKAKRTQLKRTQPAGGEKDAMLEAWKAGTWNDDGGLDTVDCYTAEKSFEREITTVFCPLLPVHRSSR
ncbi:MAG: hypothetical protein Q9215_002345 [Flavoplaca cf. flavocitrina]